MEMVEMIIKIPEIAYENTKRFCKLSTINDDELAKAIANGMPLPKGHGRLFILDEELTKKFFTSFSFSCQKWISEVGISNATLKVIESDKEIENE